MERHGERVHESELYRLRGELTAERGGADAEAALPDLEPREWAVIVPIVALTILMGVLPNLFLRPAEASVQKIVDRVRDAAPVEIQAIRNLELGIKNAYTNSKF